MDCGPGPAPVVVPNPRPSNIGGKAVSYSVLRICDHNGCVRYEAIETRLVKDREKAIQDAYLKAAREWKPGENPDSPQQQPKKPEVRVWRNVMGGPDAAERAEAIAADCRKKEQKAASKTGSEAAKTPPEPQRPPAASLKDLPPAVIK